MILTEIVALRIMSKREMIRSLAEPVLLTPRSSAGRRWLGSAAGAPHLSPVDRPTFPPDYGPPFSPSSDPTTPRDPNPV